MWIANVELPANRLYRKPNHKPIEDDLIIWARAVCTRFSGEWNEYSERGGRIGYWNEKCMLSNAIWYDAVENYNLVD